jgi:hypothetical protein
LRLPGPDMVFFTSFPISQPSNLCGKSENTSARTSPSNQCKVCVLLLRVPLIFMVGTLNTASRVTKMDVLRVRALGPGVSGIITWVDGS